MDVERLLLRVVTYTAYAAGTGGLAFALGDWYGWVVVAVAGAIPGGYLLRQQIEQQNIERAQRKPEQLDRSRLGGGPSPDPVVLPPNY